MTSTPMGERDLATVGRRVGGYLIDSGVVVALSGISTTLSLLGASKQSAWLMGLGLVVALILLTYAGISIFKLGTKGGTPGHSSLGLVVLDAESGEPIGIGRAFGRQFLLGLIGPFNLIQLFLIGNHERRQGWHDRAVKSVVWGPELPAKPLPPLPPAGRLIAAPVPQSGPLPPSLATSAPPPTGPVAHTQQRPPTGTIPPPPGAIPPPPPPPSPATPPPAPAAPAPTPAPAPVDAPVDDPMKTPVPPAPTPAPTPAPEPEPVPDPEPTARAAAAAGWSLVAATGVSTVLGGLVLAGRDPDAAIVDGATAWPLDDPQLTVSKTHALFGVTDGAPWIEDWHSTNGVLLRRGDAEEELAPHTRTPLQPGDELLLGDFSVRLQEG